MEITPYRCTSFYYRRTANTDDITEIRKTLLELIAEREKTRAWIRDKGLVPPVFNVPDGKIMDIIEQPLTDYQRRLVADSAFPGVFSQSSDGDRQI